MNTYSATVTCTINTFVANANGDITNFTMALAIDATTPPMPSNLLALDSTNKLSLGLKASGSPLKISSPIQPGDKLTIKFQANSGFGITSLPNFNGASNGPIAWGAVQVSNGVATITGTVSNSQASVGSSIFKYSIGVRPTNSTQDGTIDPDFETDVTTGAL